MIAKGELGPDGTDAVRLRCKPLSQTRSEVGPAAMMRFACECPCGSATLDCALSCSGTCDIEWVRACLHELDWPRSQSGLRNKLKSTGLCGSIDWL
eukprot:6189013-Pleurochrysis_carterae.AAC.3